MYKIMLVDDDYPVLEFLQQAIPWSELGFTLICSTEDSRIALQMATEEMPDLLITDIGMPHLNGIELIRQLKVIKSNLASIILSCHDDFSYAQQAIKLEVMDYIIKESMTPGLVIKVLEKAKQKLDDERASLSKQENADRIYNRSRRSYRVQMAKTLIEAPMIDEEYWCTEFRQLNIDFGERQYIPVCGYIHQYNNHTERFHSEDTFLYAVENILNELLEQHALPSTLRYKKMFFLVLPYDMPHREGLQLEAMLSGLRRSINHYRGRMPNANRVEEQVLSASA
jgi:two-component system response regulator YesN